MKTCLYIVGLILLVQSTMAETEMEVVLIEHIPDEARGWCIDSAGHQINAIMEGGVHGHTCYSYEGQLAVDQKFDAEGVENGYFRLSAFDHCLTMVVPESGSWIALTPCDGRKEQGFDLKDDGRIVSMAAPNLCITLGKDTVPGGGGNPIHQIRSTTLNTCSEENATLQRWRLRAHKDG